MIRILKVAEEEMLRLRRDESGVALMLTLSVILLLYVLLAGVYAIGDTVRQKIEMQNACDAAAYSAALVEADGLGRIAMVNRALAWTYVELTNMQMDYITYKWLQLVRKRFDEDATECEKHNKDSFFSPLCPDCLNGNCKHWYVGENKGWFCGLAMNGPRMININGRAVAVSDIDSALSQFKDVLKYGEKNNGNEAFISQYRNQIGALNVMISFINQNMNASISETAADVLHANLPREILVNEKTDDSGKTWLEGVNTISRGRDFAYAVMTPLATDPYADMEENGESSSCFSPLYNNELDERIFLSMADGEVYTRLQDYFYHPAKFEPLFDSYAGDRAGGLDQWFIRGYADETKMNVTKVPDDPEKQYRSLGICRVYKNTNRREGGEKLRAHHTGLLLLDTAPSTFHSRKSFPDQCDSVPDETIGLCADYEWGALRIITTCWIEFRQVGRATIPYKCHHIQTAVPITDCPHRCETGLTSGDHTRQGYKPCFLNTAKIASSMAKATATKDSPAWWPYKTNVHPHIGLYDSFANRSLTIQGYSRTYGDDKEIYKDDIYTGVPARPWVLNEKFYEKGGAIVVGLACRHRNPWVWLLNAVVPYEKRRQDGIYSAFNPEGTDPHIIVLSAARAAHRIQPTSDNTRCIKHYRLTGRIVPGVREYDVCYDGVCSDDMEAFANGMVHPTIKISSGGPSDDSNLWRKYRVGCVCGKENAERFARCWNLCETDWDATLLPLAFAWARARTNSSRWHDSLLRDSGREGTLYWESVADQNNRFANDNTGVGNVLRTLAETVVTEDNNVSYLWYPFYDENGVLFSGNTEKQSVRPTFLRRSDPEEVLKSRFL